MCCATFYIAWHNFVLRHNYLHDITHQTKVMRHKYVTQFCTTYRYFWILEEHIFIYNNQIGTLYQDLSGMGISNLLSCNNSSIVPLRLDASYRYAVKTFIKLDESLHGETVVVPTNDLKSWVRLPGDIIFRLRLHQNLDPVDRRLRVS